MQRIEAPAHHSQEPKTGPSLDVHGREAFDTISERLALAQEVSQPTDGRLHLGDGHLLISCTWLANLLQACESVNLLLLLGLRLLCMAGVG